MWRLKTIDWTFVIVPIILLIISCATIYTITYVTVGNKLVVNQMVYAGIALALLVVFSCLDYRHLKSLSFFLFIAGVALLAPLIPSLSHKVPIVICEFNACRWLNLGFFRLQPSEIFKLLSIIILSAFLSQRFAKLKWWHFCWVVVLIAIPAVLILEQPDLGTTLVVLFCALALLVAARFSWWIWVIVLIAAIIAAPIGWLKLKPYQKTRIEVFLHPERDPTKTGYNVRQAEIAVGSGGVMGRGFGKGSQSQLNFLPVAHTDFIFAGYAEATGYVGSLFLLALFGFLIWRAIHTAEISKDTFGRFLALGIAAMIAIQVFINIGMNMRLVPVTGVSLPFISFGGTALFSYMIALGILQSIVIRHKKLSFG